MFKFPLGVFLPLMRFSPIQILIQIGCLFFFFVSTCLMLLGFTCGLFCHCFCCFLLACLSCFKFVCVFLMLCKLVFGFLCSKVLCCFYLCFHLIFVTFLFIQGCFVLLSFYCFFFCRFGYGFRLHSLLSFCSCHVS